MQYRHRDGRTVKCDVASDGGVDYMQTILPYTKVIDIDGVRVRYAGPLLLLLQKILAYARRSNNKAKLSTDLRDIMLCVSNMPDQPPISAGLRSLYLSRDILTAFYNRLLPHVREVYVEALRGVGIEVGVQLICCIAAC
jgi:hypothetical protein